MKSVCANSSFTNKATTNSVVTRSANNNVSAVEVGATTSSRTVGAQQPKSAAAAAKSTKKRKASSVQQLGAQAVAAAPGGESTEATSGNRFLSDFDSHRAAQSIMQAVSIGSCFGSSTTLNSETEEAELAYELNLEKQIFGEDDSDWIQSTVQFNDDCSADDEEESRNFDARRDYYNN